MIKIIHFGLNNPPKTFDRAIINAFAYSVLIAEGFDIKKVQEWLGHSSISTTGNIYAHIQHAAKVEMGNALEKMLV